MQLGVAMCRQTDWEALLTGIHMNDTDEHG